MKPKCKLCLKIAETHVKILGVSEVTKAIEEIFNIKVLLMIFVWGHFFCFNTFPDFMFRSMIPMHKQLKFFASNVTIQ